MTARIEPPSEVQNYNLTRRHLGNYGWVKIILSIWVFRMLLLALSVGLPNIISVFYEIKEQFSEPYRSLRIAHWTNGNTDELDNAADENFPKVVTYFLS